MLAIPWRRLSSIRGGGRHHHHHHRRRHCRFELLNVGAGGEGGAVVDNGDGDLEEGGGVGGGGSRGENSSHMYNNSFSSQVLMGGVYRHSSQVSFVMNVITMSIKMTIMKFSRKILLP